jgi:hypothetical protein
LADELFAVLDRPIIFAGSGKSETVTNCHQLKMVAEDGKMRLTD